MKYIQYSFALFCTVALLSSCSQSKAKGGMWQTGPVSVEIAEVQQELVSATINYPGTIVALNETELRAEVNGYITNIFVADGATVSKGQKLYEIDRVRYQAARDQAKASLEIAQSNLDKVQRDLNRYTALDAKQAIAKQIVDYARTDFNNAKAQVDAAKASLVTAETNLQRSVIYAPYSGTIGISMVRNGALVNAGSTLLNIISSTEPIAVDIMVNEKDIQQFSKFQKDGNVQKDSILSIQLPNGEVYNYFGKVTAIDRAVNQNTGTIMVRIAFENPKGDLRVGMNVNVGVLNKIATPQIVIPYKAVMEQLNQTLVYTVSDSNTAKPQMIKLGFKLGDKVVVAEGLKVGDKVITEGIMGLKPNAPITTEKPTQATK
ncbi:MAG: efflux RND transporter periplasmic adaptor subunit [Chitinophagales bacterium]|nr:efflux RND transporter periplasmic adaptor subunit [Chitinophagales bacterium]OJV30500.1 MAG: efflux transporter periplasmic adaptor subunit [Bacteroidetes bacterium 37-13]